MSFHFPRSLFGSAGMFGRARGNARVMLAAQPIVAIPYAMFITYSSLYMRGLGLSPEQIGLLVTIANVSWMACALVGGYITDRMGRRRAILIFDLLGWTVPSAIWIVASSFWHFLAAAVLNGFAGIVAGSWMCLFMEDTDPRDRVHLLSAFHISNLVAGFFLPLAGIAVAQLGVVQGTRWIFGVFLVCVTTKVLIQNHYTRESTTGIARMAETRSLSWRDAFGDYGNSLLIVLRNPVALVLLGLTALTNFRDTLSNAFGNVYMKEALSIAPQWIAAFPTLGAAIQLAVLLTASSFLWSRPEHKSIGGGLFLSTVGYLLFALSPVGGFGVLFASTFAGAAGTALMMPALNAAWNNMLGDSERAKAMSFLLLVSALARLPSGSLGGFLYAQGPRLPFMLVTALMALAVIGYAGVIYRTRRMSGPARPV